MLQQECLLKNQCIMKAVERLKKYTENFEVGDPKKEGEHIGPVISETQYNKIQTLIKKGIDEGAKLVAGGTGKPDGLEKGYFVKPTVFADVNNMIWKLQEQKYLVQFYLLCHLKQRRKQLKLQMILLMD